MSFEIWKAVPSQPHILVSSRGRVTVTKVRRQMPNGGFRAYGGSPGCGQWDGARYIYRDSRTGKTFKLARLVCEAFNGPPTEERNVCMHLDEDSRNNCPNNLEWGTQKENLNAPGFIAYQRAAILWKMLGRDKPRATQGRLSA